MSLAVQVLTTTEDEHCAGIDERRRPMGQVDDCMIDGSTLWHLADDVSIFVDMQDQRSPGSSERKSTRRSTGERPSTGRTSQRRSFTEQANYKRTPRMSERRTDRPSVRTTTFNAEEYGTLPDRDVGEADDAPATLVVGIASIRNLKQMVSPKAKPQTAPQSEGYRSLVETEYIAPARKPKSNHRSSSSSKWLPTAAMSTTSDDFLTSSLHDPVQKKGPMPSDANGLVPVPPARPPATTRRPYVAKKLAVSNMETQK